jgi:hypothetical protein
MATEINLPPVGMLTEAGAKRVSEALEHLNIANAEVGSYMAQIWDEEASYWLDPEVMAEVQQRLDARSAAQDELLRAVAGRQSTATAVTQ